MEKHEAVYQTLKEKGYDGWGGKKYDERMRGLDKNLTRLLSHIKLEGGRVLELGSGAGDVSMWFAEKGFEATGVEISETAVKWSIEKAGDLNTRFICSSVTEEHLLMNESFDLIIDGNCLHCLFDEDRTAFYHNVKRLLNPKGYFYVASVMANKAGETAVVGPIERCFLTEESLLDEITGHGFELVTSWITRHESHGHFIGVFKHS